MKLRSKKNRVLMVVIGLGAVLLITTGWSVMADIVPVPICVPRGVYIGVYPAHQWTFIRTVIPTDPAGNTITSILSCDNADPTFGITDPPFSEVDHMTDYIGPMVRTGPNTWAHTAISYGTKKVEGQPKPEIVYIQVFEGTFTYTDDGNTEVVTGDFAIYLSEQDADGDGFPDEGATPIYCGPIPTVTATRMPMAMLGPCE